MEWQKKGYLIKLINKRYLFADVLLTEAQLYRNSNYLYQPSYLSLESALAHYSLIPEAVYLPQAVTTRKTMCYRTPVGTFQYRTIKASCYFGYAILQTNKFPILIAEVEKALLDYLYLNPRLKTIRDIEAIRLNIEELNGQVDLEKLFRYAAIFASPTLDKRIRFLQKIMADARLN